MNEQDLLTAGDPDLIESFAAMVRAAELARETAILTNTAIILSENGKVVRVDAETLRQQKAEKAERGSDG